MKSQQQHWFKDRDNNNFKFQIARSKEAHANTATMEPQTTETTRTNHRSKTICCRMVSTLGPYNVRQMIFAVVILSLVIALLNPLEDPNEVDAKKIKLKGKEKKVLKSLVKGLILKNLSTRKNFLPMPVPIPGKWQQILTTIVDSGLLSGSESLEHKRFTSALSSYLSARRGGGSNKLAGQSSSSSSSSSSLDLAAIKKYTRVAAAKYAGKIISSQVPKGSSTTSSFGKHTAMSDTADHRRKLNKAMGSTTSTDNRKSGQKNDFLVTLFNLVKLGQQLKGLELSNLINLNKKSSSSSLIDTSIMPPLSMNINSKKSFINKMHYIHKLTQGHRHRHNRLSVLS